MKNSLVLKIIISSLILFSVHYLIVDFFFPEFVILGVLQIHLYLSVLTCVLVFILEKIRAKNQIRFGQAYLVSVVLKMFASATFLLPFILGQNKDEKLFVVQFFAAFFIYLFLEVYLLVSKLKNQP